MIAVVAPAGSGYMTEGGQNHRHDRVSADGAFDVVVDGYDAVYSALSASPEFAGLWAQHAYGGTFPAGFEHISFLTFSELQDMADYSRSPPIAFWLTWRAVPEGPACG